MEPTKNDLEFDCIKKVEAHSDFKTCTLMYVKELNFVVATNKLIKFRKDKNGKKSNSFHE